MKKKIKWVILGVVLLIAVIVLSNCFFVLREDEAVLVQRFGRIEKIYVKTQTEELRRQLDEDGETLPVHEGTGLKLKLPFVDNVIRYTAKLVTYDVKPHEVITQDKKKLYFDNNAQWRIENPLRFYKALNNMNSAATRIDDRLYSNMNIIIGKENSTKLITEKEESGMVMSQLTEAVNKDCKRFGIYIADIRIKRTDLPSETYESIYNNMNTERQKIAAQYRSEGEEEFIKIRSQTDREVVTITSEATREAEEIKGEADSEAARIFNEAYGKNPEFFEFYNLLDTYRETVGAGSTLVVPHDSPFARYLLGVSPGSAPSAPPPATPSAPPDGNEP